MKSAVERNVHQNAHAGKATFIFRVERRRLHRSRSARRRPVCQGGSANRGREHARLPAHRIPRRRPVVYSDRSARSACKNMWWWRRGRRSVTQQTWRRDWTNRVNRAKSAAKKLAVDLARYMPSGQTQKVLPFPRTPPGSEPLRNASLMN